LRNTCQVGQSQHKVSADLSDAKLRRRNLHFGDFDSTVTNANIICLNSVCWSV